MEALFVLVLLGLIACVIVLFVSLGTLSSEVSAMRREVIRLRAWVEYLSNPGVPVHPPTPHVEPPRPTPPVSQPVRPPTPPVQPTPPVFRAPEPVAPPRLVADAPVQPPIPPFVPVTPRSEPSAPRPPRPRSRSQEEWETLIGGKWFNWLGAIALVIGVGFAYRWAIDNGYVPPAVRVLLGVAVGAALLVCGRLFHTRGLPVFARGLIGAGVAVLYVAVYAAYGFYHPPLVPVGVALILLSAVTAVAFWQALVYDSPAVSILALLGGFLTPIVLHTGPSPASAGWTLFLYLLFLNAGVLAVQYAKSRWAMLEPLALAGTYALLFLWIGDHTPLATALPIPFVFGIWLLFGTLHLLRARRGDAPNDAQRVWFAANGVLAIVALNAVCLPNYADARFLVALLLTAGYGAFAAVLRHAPGFGERTAIRHELAAFAVLTLAWWVQCSGLNLAMIWTVQGLALVLAGLGWRRPHAWISGLLVLSFALAALCFAPGAFAFAPIADFHPALNPRAVAFLVLAVALAVSAIAFARRRDETGHVAATVLHYAWMALCFMLISVEVNDLFVQMGTRGQSPEQTFSGARFMMLAVAWTVYAMPLVWVGIRRRSNPLVVVGLVSLCLGFSLMAVRAAWYTPLTTAYLPVINLRGLPMLAVIAALLVLIRLVRRERDAVHAPVFVEAFRAMAAVLAFEVITVELISTVHAGQMDALARTREVLAFALPMALAAAWGVFAAASAWLGHARQSAVLRWSAICALGAAVVCVAIFGVSVLPLDGFSLLINLRAPAFLTVIAAVLLVRWALKADKTAATPGGMVPALSVIAAVLGLELLTTEFLDLCGRHLLMGDSLAAPHWAYARIIGVAVLWTLYGTALLWFGQRRRLPELVGYAMVQQAFALPILLVAALSYEPIAAFVPILNLRAAALAVGMLGIGVQAVLLKREGEEHWGTSIRTALQVMIAVIGFELVTVEISDYFRMNSGDTYVGSAEYLRNLIWPTTWTLYALPVIWLALRRRFPPLLWCGVAALIAGVLWMVVAGAGAMTIGSSIPLLNVRAALFLLVILLFAWQISVLRTRDDGDSPAQHLVPIFRVAVALLVLELVTVETWNAFDTAIFHGGTEAGRLSDLRQLALSVAWLVFAIGLLGYAFWQRMKPHRLMAMGILILTVLKIFLIDLLFFVSEYRTVSFISLGLILFGASYLYQRYRTTVKQPTPADPPEEPVVQ